MHFQLRHLCKPLQQRLGRGAEMRRGRAVVLVHVPIVGGQESNLHLQIRAPPGLDQREVRRAGARLVNPSSWTGSGPGKTRLSFILPSLHHRGVRSARQLKS